jgi:hypothetical protein
MPTNTTYSPGKLSDFEASKLNYNGQSASANVPAGQSADIDITMTDDHLLTGGWLMISGGDPGNSCTFQVVHPIAGVVNQFITSWKMPAECFTPIMVPYPAKIYAGLTLRLVFVNSGATDCIVAINYDLHKVLI